MRSGDRSLFVPTAPAGSTTKQIANAEFVYVNALGATDFISGLIKSPTNQDYRIVERLPYASTISFFTAKTSTGTITATLKIDSTSITGGALNASSTQTSVTPSALNTAALGSALVLTGSAATTPSDLSFTVVFNPTV